ncbi:hypothetical protein BTM25_48770 [Actinomadura rubteroloni]|uniref:Endonuclease n=1 Tax=Actinomadura rubteroloni TaxID=1926885 RepID=A0A2P4UCA9_9ACTN|nr:endonuclease [Actinomadura rubteroloni]POM22673.1 hypothetical protein BTM25_48770 [Actinomadura rubteroloni]
MDAKAKKLLDDAGRQTYAEEAGIPVKDQPAALWKLLVLANLLSTRISAKIAVAAARELFAAGGGTPRGMAGLSWQQRVDALGRAHYRRYDEGTSTRLGRMAEIVLDVYGGDLRRLPDKAGRDRSRAAELLEHFPGIGPTGADIFCREAQAVWPWLRPYVDRLALRGADRVGLPGDPGKAGVPGKDVARFTAGLVRVARDKKLADAVARA